MSTHLSLIAVIVASSHYHLPPTTTWYVVRDIMTLGHNLQFMNDFWVINI